MQYGLIGEHLTHSYSCEIHGKIADYHYELCELRPDELDGFLREPKFKAINVTIPYKQSVIPYLYYISDQAKSIGAVNTIVNRDGKLYGYNTDFMGMEALFEHMGVSLKGKKVLILGTGGTSKTARAVAEALGAREIHKVSRKSGEGVITYDEVLSAHNDAEIIINTTPVGMFPKSDARPIDISEFTKLEGILDAIYNPLRTNLVQDGQERGIPASGGLYMLSGQAVFASAIFQGIETDTKLINTAYTAVRDQKRNIVLIGMPSCGKTTVGKMLSQETNMELIDTDELITQRVGSIADFIREKGETAFRDVESEVIKSIADKSGCIIATGGGAVLRHENVRALKHNGVVVFLDRALENLITTDDRPLSSSREALCKRYHERYDIYRAAADVIIDANTDINEEVKKLREEVAK